MSFPPRTARQYQAGLTRSNGFLHAFLASVIELLSSDDVMGLGDEMGMDEDSASGSDIEVDVPPPPPYQKRTARAPVKRTRTSRHELILFLPLLPASPTNRS